MTFPSVNDRVVLHGRVDEVALTGAVYIELDDVRPIISGRHLVRAPITVPIPESTGHVLLKAIWQGGEHRDQVLILGKVIQQGSGLAVVQFPTDAGTSVLLPYNALIYGQYRGENA